MNTENAETNKFQEEAIAPMHTAEHLLNRTMVNKFRCERSRNAHIERKKSKITYILPVCPSETELEEVVATMNQLIKDDLPVVDEYCDKNNLPDGVSLDRLPADAACDSKIRLVRIGDYDICPCIGLHVNHTGALGQFILLGTNWDEEKHTFRIRFKLNAMK